MYDQSFGSRHAVQKAGTKREPEAEGGGAEKGHGAGRGVRGSQSETGIMTTGTKSEDESLNQRHKNLITGQQ